MKSYLEIYGEMGNLSIQMSYDTTCGWKLGFLFYLNILIFICKAKLGGINACLILAIWLLSCWYTFFWFLGEDTEDEIKPGGEVDEEDGSCA